MEDKRQKRKKTHQSTSITGRLEMGEKKDATTNKRKGKKLEVGPTQCKIPGMIHAFSQPGKIVSLQST